MRKLNNFNFQLSLEEELATMQILLSEATNDSQVRLIRLGLESCI